MISRGEVSVFELWRGHSRPIGRRTNYGYDSTNSTRLLIWACPSRVWSPILNCATTLRVRERIDRDRAAQLAIVDWVVSSCEVQETVGNLFLVENQWRHELESIFHSKASGRSLCVRGNFTLLHVRGQGSVEPKRAQETRQVLDNQSTALEICRSKVPEQTCSRTGERTHERTSEFASLAHTCLGTSGDPYPMMSSLRNHMLKRREFPKKYPMR